MPIAREPETLERAIRYTLAGLVMFAGFLGCASLTQRSEEVRAGLVGEESYYRRARPALDQQRFEEYEQFLERVR